jgi:hypothetical protein
MQREECMRKFLANVNGNPEVRNSVFFVFVVQFVLFILPKFFLFHIGEKTPLYLGT